jgi:hypothetical protein
MARQKKIKAFTPASQKWKYRATAGPQNEAEERRFTTALDLFLAEWVRQRMSQGRSDVATQD